MLQLAIPTKIAVVDSTPRVDLYDIEAAWVHANRGKFRGFKLHTAVNQSGLPLRVIVTPENRYDESYLSKLIWDLDADFVLTDLFYSSKWKFEAVINIAMLVIADNPRKK